MADPIRLTPERVVELKQAQRALHDVLPDIDALEQCGADCQIPREQWQLAQDRIANLLKFFSPGAKRDM